MFLSCIWEVEWSFCRWKIGRDRFGHAASQIENCATFRRHSNLSFERLKIVAMQNCCWFRWESAYSLNEGMQRIWATFERNMLWWTYDSVSCEDLDLFITIFHSLALKIETIHLLLSMSLLPIRFSYTVCERALNPCHTGVNTGWLILYCNVTLSIHHPSTHPRKTGAQVTPECDIKGYVCIQISKLFATYLKVEGSVIYIIWYTSGCT